MFSEIVDFIRSLYDVEESIILHKPVFFGNEKKYLTECVDSSYVSYVGKFVDQFEQMIVEYTGVKYAIAVVNGTAALQIALKVAGVTDNDEVITQALSFIATANAIRHCNASPVFIDIDKETIGMSPESLIDFLSKNTKQINGRCINIHSKRVISGCVPVHVFGHPCRIDEIVEICNKFNIRVVEDAAESLGSFFDSKHTGTFGKLGILSFNGNKTITTGGGGMIITNDKELALKSKHLTTTAKKPHKWEFEHDDLGYNYRMPNINASIGVAQLENIESIIRDKKDTASKYKNFFDNTPIRFICEPERSNSNYWLNSIVFKDREDREKFLEFSNEKGVMCRPVWKLIPMQKIYSSCLTHNIDNAKWLADRIVNLPSGVKINKS